MCILYFLLNIPIEFFFRLNFTAAMRYQRRAEPSLYSTHRMLIIFLPWVGAPSTQPSAGSKAGSWNHTGTGGIFFETYFLTVSRKLFIKHARKIVFKRADSFLQRLRLFKNWCQLCVQRCNPVAQIVFPFFNVAHVLPLSFYFSQHLHTASLIDITRVRVSIHLINYHD